MKVLKFAAASIAAMLMTTGCTTIYRVSSETQPASPQDPGTRMPVASVKATPANEQAKPLSEYLKASLGNDLAARGFDVTAKAPADSLVTLNVSRRETARLNDWRTYEGRVDARVTEVATKRLVASKSFTAAGQRALDDVKAMEGVKGGLSKQVSKWLSGVMVAKPIPLPPPPPSAAVELVTIKPANPLEDPADVLAVQRRFMDVVSAHQGVVSCRLVREDPSQRAYVFSVAYNPEAFPGGLLNTIVLDAPRLGGGIVLEIVR